MSLSGHKFHAPKGVGILYVKNPKDFEPCNFGGGQEKGMRSGTENVASIVGMGKAAELYNYSPEEYDRMWNLNYAIRSFIKNQIADTYFTLDYATTRVVPNIISVAFKDVYGGDLVELMSEKGVYIGSGSACSSNSGNDVSATIQRSRLPDELKQNVIRISMSNDTTKDEVNRAVRIMKACVEQIRALK